MWASSLHSLNCVRKAVYFSDKLKHPDPWATESGQKPVLEARVQHPPVHSGHLPSRSQGRDLVQALQIQRAVCPGPGPKELPVGPTRQMCKHESRGRRTGARTEGQPGFSKGTTSANEENSLARSRVPWPQDDSDGSSMFTPRQALIYSFKVPLGAFQMQRTRDTIWIMPPLPWNRAIPGVAWRPVPWVRYRKLTAFRHLDS